MNKINSRKRSRKYLFQKIFSSFYTDNTKEEFEWLFLTDSYKWKVDEEYINEMEKIIKDKQAILVYILQKYAPKFSPERMDKTYVIPIFIALAEMFFFSWEIPAKVSINEAIELAKLYWTETSPKIVNWVLNSVLKNYDSLKQEISEKNFSDSKLNLFVTR